MAEPVSRPRILVVDDMPNWLGQIVEILGTDYEVKAFSKAEDAARAIDALDFDVAVLDVRFEAEGGFERDVMGLGLLRQIKEKTPEAGVVILTGYPQDVRKKVPEIYEPDAFIEKRTFNVKSFRYMIQRIIKKRKAK